jgi:pimeloyl-ACP methyl ester carboxylesterase
MGLGGIKSAWQRQTKDFGHTQGDKYSVLVFDNRGIGDSGKPLMRYSTLEMAKDVVELVDHVGWTGKRDLNVVGISMGGMIAQELVSPSPGPSALHLVLVFLTGNVQALLIPERIGSLSLVSTACALKNTVVSDHWPSCQLSHRLRLPQKYGEVEAGTDIARDSGRTFTTEQCYCKVLIAWNSPSHAHLSQPSSSH